MSGEERNCMFLNTRGRRFATASATSGFDFLDDARAIALTDWDLDGDLDVWVSNRTAPRVRFLRNDLPASSERRFLGLRLEGKTANRDAIGARVELKFKDRPDIIRTLRAGEGFLGQSSKWMHFGVGDATQVDRVIVRWPGRAVQEFRNLDLGRYHVLVEGDDRAKASEEAYPLSSAGQRPRKQLESGVPKIPKPTEQAALLLSDRLPVPPFAVRRFSGERVGLSNLIGRPILLNLWASWCAPCVAELKEITAHANELKALDLEIVAVSLDGQDDSQTSTPRDAQALLAKLGFPFVAGIPTNDFLPRIQGLYDLPYAQHRPMPVPTSFLIDRNGLLAAVYRGPLTVDQLRGHLELLRRSDRTSNPEVLPFPGIWHRAPAPGSDKAFLSALDLMKSGAAEDVVWFVEHHLERVRTHSEFPKLMAWTGGEFSRRGNMSQALSIYQKALAVSPTNVLLLNNLAWDLAAHPNPALRDGPAAVNYAEQAARLTNRRDGSILDTLAAAYAQAGRFPEAAAAMREALALLKAPDDEARRVQWQRTLDQYEARKLPR